MSWELLRRRAGSKTIDLFLRTASRSARLHPESRRWLSEVQIEPDLSYQGETSQSASHCLDIYRPRSVTGPLPVLLYVHGGGFRILSKESHWMMAAGFARRGYLVCTINYRLAPEHPFPAALEDTCQAWLWLLAHLESLGGDPNRIAVSGESAGGNLVTALTVASTFQRSETWARAVFERGRVPDAVIAACGILQTSHPERFRNNQMPNWVNDRIVETCTAYLGGKPALPGSLADPLLILESDREADRPLPPLLAPVGDADPIREDSFRLAAALKARGVFASAPAYVGQGHAFHAVCWTRASRRCWSEQLTFLAEHLGTPGATPATPSP